MSSSPIGGGGIGALMLGQRRRLLLPIISSGWVLALGDGLFWRAGRTSK
ncbi:MAG: hypothetical protein ACRD1R_05915 [Acidobacteriota bacterium]